MQVATENHVNASKWFVFVEEFSLRYASSGSITMVPSTATSLLWNGTAWVPVGPQSASQLTPPKPAEPPAAGADQDTEQPAEPAPDTKPEPADSPQASAEGSMYYDDELGKMMGGVKRRNSSASLNSKAGQLHMDSAVNSPIASSDENGGHVTNVQQAYGHGHGNSHILRRKGSLRTKNESPATVGKFAIKPIGPTALKPDAEDVDELAGDGKEEIKESIDPLGGKTH